MKKLFLLLFLIPNLVMGEPIAFVCDIKWDYGTGAYADTKFINTDEFREVYILEDDVLKKDGHKYLCTKDDAFLNCIANYEDETTFYPQTISIDRISLSLKFKRDIFLKPSMERTNDFFQYKGRCRIETKKQF